MMQSAAVNKELCHASHINREMMTCRQHQSLNQQYQQFKMQQKYRKDTRNEMLRFQFRIVMMPHSLQMRSLLPTNSLLATLSIVVLFVVTSPPVCQAAGYSYSRFSGPVTGPEYKVVVHDGLAGGVNGDDGRPSVDYIAKPAYEFAYGIEDAQARLLQNRQESRDGDAVRGSYSVVDPDGNLRVVKYTADHINGFQAEVTTNGLNTVVHGQQPPVQVPPAPSWYNPHTVQNQVQHPAANIVDDDSAGKGDYEVNEDYEENEDNEDENEKYGKHKEADGESGENYDNEDEHEDYDGNEQSAEVSKEATSYEEQSGEYY